MSQLPTTFLRNFYREFLRNGIGSKTHKRVKKRFLIDSSVSVGYGRLTEGKGHEHLEDNIRE